MVAKLFAGNETIEIHHEYLPNHIQPLSAMYGMGLISKEEVKGKLLELYGSALFYSKSKYWVDCTHKLSWLIQPLSEVFPQAKFVYITRDGRKVVSSFFHKLGDEIYDDESVAVMQNWLSHRAKQPTPPPEKKYWWIIPQEGQPFAQEFPRFNQFERICYHWKESNRVIIDALGRIPKEQQFRAKLETLTINREILRTFLDFFEIEYDEYFFDLVQTPQHVIIPMDFKLVDDEGAQFSQIAGDMMMILGYAGSDEYTVDYGK
jgi:hypothetical protein